MSTQEVANRLVALCRQNQNLQAIEELYADHITSREMPGIPGEVTTGKDAVREKSKQWLDNVQEIHYGTTSEPVVAGDHFSCKMEFDITFKDSGRQHVEEICVFQVKEGKIINEQFFYPLPPQ